MKKFIAVFLALICLCLSACDSVDLEYYSNTNVPTFTCVTKIEASEKNYLSSVGAYVYVYHCKEEKQEQFINKYIDYLKKEQGYTVVESDDGYQMITLAKDNAGVIISVADSQTVHVMPYKRSV